jgi:hypothetical protein
MTKQTGSFFFFFFFLIFFVKRSFVPCLASSLASLDFGDEELLRCRKSETGLINKNEDRLNDDDKDSAKNGRLVSDASGPKKQSKEIDSVQVFKERCSCAASTAGDAKSRSFKCERFVEAYAKYALWRKKVLSDDDDDDESNREERNEAKYLVVKTNWQGVGLGHIGYALAEWMMFAMRLKRVLFIEELSEWRAQEFFEAYLNVDFLYTEKEELMLRERVGGKAKEATLAIGVIGKDESTCRKGHCRARSLEEEKLCREWDDANGLTKPEYCKGQTVACSSADIHSWQCEPCLECAMDLFENAKWLTIRSNEGIKPPSLVADPDLKHGKIRHDIWRSDWIERDLDKEWDIYSSLTKLVDKSKDREDAFFPPDVAQHPCLRCAYFSALRPRSSLAKEFAPVLASEASESEHLQCLKVRTGYPESPMCFPDETHRTDVCVDQILSHPTCAVSYETHMAVRLVSDEDAKRQVTIKEALNCLSSKKNATIHVATDAPVINDYVKLFSPRNNAKIFITPGKGVDLNNGYRDTQEITFQNKLKVALDFYIQGWCDEVLMLSPSEYYVAAALRTMDPPVAKDTKPSLCSNVFGFNTAYNYKEASKWSHAPTHLEKGAEARKHAETLGCYVGNMDESDPKTHLIAYPHSIGDKMDSDLKASLIDKAIAAAVNSEKKNNESASSSVNERPVRILMDEEPPLLLPLREDDDREPKDKNVDGEEIRRHKKLVAKAQWHKEAHDVVMDSINKHALIDKERHEMRKKELEEESRGDKFNEVDEIKAKQIAYAKRKDRLRETHDRLNKFHDARRAELIASEEGRKEVDDIASSYDRMLNADEKDIERKTVNHQSNEALEDELEKIAELEKRPIEAVLADVPKEYKAAKVGQEVANNFGHALFIVFLVLVFIVTRSVIRRRRKRMFNSPDPFSKVI